MIPQAPAPAPAAAPAPALDLSSQAWANQMSPFGITNGGLQLTQDQTQNYSYPGYDNGAFVPPPPANYGPPPPGMNPWRWNSLMAQM